MRLRELPVLIIAGLLSAAIAGILAVILAATFVAGPQGIVLGAYALLFFGGHVVGAALLVGALPAMLLGGLLLWTGEERPWALRWPAWTAAGAAAGAAAFALCVTVNMLGFTELVGNSSPERPALIAAFVLAGAIAALSFRAIFLLGRAVMPDEA